MAKTSRRKASRRPDPAGSGKRPGRPAAPADTEIFFGQSAGRPRQRLISDTAVYEEALQDGRLVTLYWSASGQPQRANRTVHYPGMDPLHRRGIEAFDLEMDGQLLHNRWQWVEGASRAGPRRTIESVVALRHEVRPVTVKVVTRLDGTVILSRYLEITNTGKRPAALSNVSPWSGILWNVDHHSSGDIVNPSAVGVPSTFSVGYLNGLKSHEEGHFTWVPLPEEKFRIERPSRSHGSPYYLVRNEITGEMFFMGLAWSAGYYTEFAFRHGGLLTFKSGPLGPAPLRIIDPGETVCSCQTHLGPVHGNLDDAVEKWYRHLQTSVMPAPPKGKNVFLMSGRIVEEAGDWILKEIDLAAEMGAEGFMVDAGWYGDEFGRWRESRGDWWEGSWLPGGLKGLREHCHRKGMLFGLWHEAECLRPECETAREHPEWLLRTDGQRNVDGTVDLSVPACAEYVEETTLRLLRDHKLDFYKLDYNSAIGEGGQRERDGYVECEDWRHYEVINRLYDRVGREFPDVALENCASGGGRSDLNMLSRFHCTCTGDFSCPPYGVRAINGLTLFIPPWALTYYHNHKYAAHLLADMETHLRTTLFCVPVFVGFGATDATLDIPYYRRTRRYIELHKSFCRPLLAGHCRVYHHTPYIGVRRPADWCVLEYGAQDMTSGYAGVFKLIGHGAANEYQLFPRGIDPARNYDVTLDNTNRTFRAGGYELMNQGLRIELHSGMTSELVMYQAEGKARKARPAASRSK